jgi:hypothetical protein
MGVIGTQRYCNQGTAKDGSGGTLQTTDPTPLAGAGTQTCVDVTGPPVRLCGLRCLSVSDDFKGKEIAIRFFNLSGKQLYASGWMKALDTRRLESLEQRLANGVYLYLIQVKDADGKVQTQLKKLIIQR